MNENTLNTLVQNKKNTVSELLKIIKETNDQSLRDKIAFVLVDNFKSEEIELYLIELIKDDRWKNKNGTILYLLNEYFYRDISKHLYFLTDLLISNENDGEVFMNCFSIILGATPPFPNKDITEILNKLRREEKKKTNSDFRLQLLKSLNKFFQKQREIAKFYKLFGVIPEDNK